MKYIQTILFLAFSTLFFSCETEIDVSLPSYQNEMVVEGWIELGESPKVSLYKSLPYLSDINLNTLYNQIIIQNAVVTVTSEDGESEILQLVQSNDAPLYWYYTGTTLKGKLNTQYTLSIDWNNHLYSSTTLIPDTFTMDSLWLQKFEGFDVDTLGILRLKWQDDPSQKNYYMFRVKVANKLYSDRTWLTSFPIAIDDIAFTGRPYTLDILRIGTSSLYMPSNISDDDEWSYNRPYYELGDTIYLKSSVIDFPSYKFWTSAQGSLYFGDNPFANPPKIYSNITSSTGAKCLGAWIGGATTTRTIIFNKRL